MDHKGWIPINSLNTLGAFYLRLFVEGTHADGSTILLCRLDTCVFILLQGDGYPAFYYCKRIVQNGVGKGHFIFIGVCSNHSSQLSKRTNEKSNEGDQHI